ncbi:MAG TPA: DedA family protein [Acidothermaceae bacterium]|nr:DedA family protein [Acidothermaceae bacterium]
MFGQFTHLVAEASLWAYVVILLFAAFDAVLPIVPSETAVITAGVVASAGDLFLPLVIAVAAGGAFVGDNVAYFLGLRYGHRIKERFFSGEKAKRRVAWAEHQLTERGGELIAAGRFIPGGRTAVTLSAGTLAYPWQRFATFDAIAAMIWGLYGSLLGFFGGRAFENSPLKGLLLAFGIALAVTGGIEAVRWFLRRRR